MIKSTHQLEAFLEIRDILYEQGGLEIDDMILDAVVNVVVVQTGTNELYINYLEVRDSVVYLENEGSPVILNYNASKDTVTGELMTEFKNEIERIATNIAKNTPEDEWEYRIVE